MRETVLPIPDSTPLPLFERSFRKESISFFWRRIFIRKILACQGRVIQIEFKNARLQSTAVIQWSSAWKSIISKGLPERKLLNSLSV